MSEEIDAAKRFVRAKVDRQGGVPSFYDNRIMQLIGDVQSARSYLTPENARTAATLREIREYVSLVEKPRFEDPSRRLNRSDDLVGTYTALGMSVLTRSQGIAHVPSWAGHMIFKTAYDMVMYAMLIGESKPRTIIELGSGAGGSAVWMADVAHAHGLRPRIVSVDLNPIDVVDSRIEFRQGDLREVSRVIPAADLREFEHPWLVIEDAHVNISQVLDHLDSGIAPGDYLVVEDSYRKRAHLRSFIESSRNSYMLDLKYLDMFGENSVCSMDSLFVAVDGPNRSPLAASNE